MTAPVIQGWCPGALRPMASGDGLVVRIRPQGGRLSADQAAGIATLAAAHGNGLIDLSARANLQMRGVTEATFPALIAGLQALDLIDADAEAEARRNIVVSPFWRADDGTQAIAAGLAAALRAPDAPALPGKFGFALEADGPPVLRATSADVRIERHTGGWLIQADSFVRGAVVATPGAAVAAAMALAEWFVAAAGGGVSGRGRMARLWPDQPADARQARLPDRFADVPVGLAAAPVPGPGSCAAGWLVGFEFGQMPASVLAALAGLGALRVTPWRMLLVEGLRQAPDLPSVITRAEDPMLRVIACTGAPGCLQALAPTRGVARAVAPQVQGRLHVAGCAKGCAHPAAAEVTLVATRDGFDLIRDGTAQDAPALRGLSAAHLASHPELLAKARR